MVERHVQTVKRVLKQSLDDKKDPYLSLLELMNTPIGNGLESPNKIIQGRNVLGLLPDFAEIKSDKNNEIRSKFSERQTEQKRYHDRRAKDLPSLVIGQKVRVQNKVGTWDPAQVVNNTNNNRSYEIRTEKGNVLTRNRVQLRNDATENIKIEPDIVYDIPKLEHSDIATTQNNYEIEEAKGLYQKEILNGNSPGKKIDGTRSRTRETRKPRYLDDYIT